MTGRWREHQAHIFKMYNNFLNTLSSAPDKFKLDLVFSWFLKLFLAGLSVLRYFDFICHSRRKV